MEIKERKPKIVWTPYGVGTAIAAACGVSEVTVSNALTGKIDTAAAEKVRYVAIKEFGGVAVTHYNDGCPTCDTVHDADGVMTQVYSERVKLVADFGAGMAGVYIDGVCKSTHELGSLADFMVYQQSAMDAAQGLER